MAYCIEHSPGFVRLTLSGQVNEQDLTAIAIEAAEIEARLDVTPDRLTDLSAVEAVFLNFSSMDRFAAKRRIAPLKNKVRSAIVAPQPLQFGFARMFQTLNDHPDIEIRLFRELQSAEQWLASTRLAGAPMQPAAK